MFNLLQSASDDQTAIGACLLTLAGAAVLVFASFHLGPAGKKLREMERDKAKSRMLPQVTVEPQTRERAA